LLGTILVAIFGTIVLAGVPGQVAPDVAAVHSVGPASMHAYFVVFLLAAGTLTVTFMALLLLEEKPLQTTMPAPRS
jgi:O-antigen/teichoic acid export membrane protein